MILHAVARYYTRKQSVLGDPASATTVYDGIAKSCSVLFYHPGRFLVVGWYQTYPGDNGHVVFEFCNIFHRGCFVMGGDKGGGAIRVQWVIFRKCGTPTQAAGG